MHVDRSEQRRHRPIERDQRVSGLPRPDEPLRELDVRPQMAVLGRGHSWHRTPGDEGHARRRHVLPPDEPRSDRPPKRRRPAERVHPGDHQRTKWTKRCNNGDLVQPDSCIPGASEQRGGQPAVPRHQLQRR